MNKNFKEIVESRSICAALGQLERRGYEPHYTGKVRLPNGTLFQDITHIFDKDMLEVGYFSASVLYVLLCERLWSEKSKRDLVANKV